MNKNIILSLVMGFSCSLSACSDWVDIKTKGKLIPEETVNYRYLMNNTGNFKYTLSYQDVASDDIMLSRWYPKKLLNDIGMELENVEKIR